MTDANEQAAIRLARAILREIQTTLTPRGEAAAQLEAALAALGPTASKSEPTPPRPDPTPPRRDPTPATIAHRSQLEAMLKGGVQVDEDGRMFLCANVFVPSRKQQPAAGSGQSACQHLNALASAIAAAEQLGFSQAQVQAALDDPEEVIATPKPAHAQSSASYFCRGAVAALVSDQDQTVLAVHTREHARQAASQPAGHKVAGGKGGGGGGWSYSLKDIEKMLLAHGFTIDVGSRHRKVSHPCNPSVRIPLTSSPSDTRWVRNFVLEIRRQFGIDIRSDPNQA